MARSHKATPGWTDYSVGRRWHKRQASKAVRRYQRDLSSGRAYTRLYCSWYICDHKWLYYTARLFRLEQERHEREGWGPAHSVWRARMK